ncbi:hypothetical protein ACP70R_044690 [Stipagrostis hirtigluma subsp. patula]
MSDPIVADYTDKVVADILSSALSDTSLTNFEEFTRLMGSKQSKENCFGSNGRQCKKRCHDDDVVICAIRQLLMRQGVPPNKALCGSSCIDPVAGTGKHKYWHLTPKILAYNPSSFDIAMPVLVVGTGLGEEKKNILFPAGAPKDVNHRDFYRRCKPPCYYFVTKDHGHLDMLDDGAAMLQNFFVKKGKNCKDWMRRSVAGIMVAFLKAMLSEKDHDLKVILENPGMAPTVLDPVEHRLG